MIDASFYKNKKILITGHTGFKGSWLCAFLLSLGADVYGYALEPEHPSLFEECELEKRMHSYYGDIRDYDTLKTVFNQVQPEIVFHMAAQPIVRESYKDPKYTYEVNMLGTLNILECIRQSNCVTSFINVTTDKVYENTTNNQIHTESDPLNGYDPYANSKSCSELITDTYRRCYFIDENIPISTVRAGNVIGSGDYSKDRIIPDCIKAATNHQVIQIRNPESIRPYQHVLDALAFYLLLAQRQMEDPSLQGAYNVGPNQDAYTTTEQLVSLFCETWNHTLQDNISWEIQSDHGPYESNFLMLDTTKAKKALNYEPNWSLAQAMQEIVNSFVTKEDKYTYILSCIKQYMNS